MTGLRSIEIVGGGLAGLSLGVALRRHGISVTLHEAGRYPRHRVCGEFIAGLSDSTIAALGLESLLVDALRHNSVAWYIGEQTVQYQVLPHPALALSRHQLDTRLAENFVASGGDLRLDSRYSGPINGAGKVITTGRRRSGSTWIGLKIHALNLPLRCDLELHLGDQCYVGLTGLPDGRVNVCGLFRKRQVSARREELLLTYLRLAGLGDLAGRMSEVTLDPDSFCAVAAVEFDRRVPVLDQMRLGDASAMIPPFTGNGMAMAFQCAESALPVLLSYAHGNLDWAVACRAVHAALRRRFRTRLASAGMLHPFLLQPGRQRWFSRLARNRLVPLKALYSALH